MVQHQRLIIHHGRKDERFRVSAEEGGGLKRAKQKFLSLLFLSILSCCFILSPYLFGFSTLSLLDSFSRESESLSSYESFTSPLCSDISNGTICCDRTGLRSDICVMKGDVRTSSASSSLFLFTSSTKNNTTKPEKIKPYTRKWETSVMDTVQELNLITKDSNKSSDPVCDVYHDVPAVFFSTGGYTGNVYHEFNDGIIPLFITSQRFNKKVVFVIVEYHDWWEMKYGDIVNQLSDYPLVDFNGDSRTHCFKEATVGLRIHDELTVNSTLMVNGNQTIVDFRNVLDRAYSPRIQSLIQEANETTTTTVDIKKPKLVIMSRNGSSRAILNENLLVKLAEQTGFNVEVLRPDKRTEMAKIYRSMNTSDVMIGVHGAAMTHFLFLKPKTVFIQIVPLGTDWAAETYYGEPAKKLGLKYVGYKITPEESSLYDEYGRDDPVIRDPDSLNDKGWEYTKKIYLQGQNVKLDLRRFRETLTRSYDFSIRRRFREEVPRLLVT
uniref:EGF domain-specific O-linked N-acetylglucosamine transferase n=1 Tax=Noccaea caerulescens TaxID=107243 RepID=A0A1J3HVX9_NOCCA